jgi:putative membrane protein
MMWDGHWREMMGGWGFYPWGGLHMLFSLAALALLVAFIVSLFSHRHGGPHHREMGSEGDQRTGIGLAILEERYVRGEIDREEFMVKKRDLMG